MDRDEYIYNLLLNSDEDSVFDIINTCNKEDLTLRNIELAVKRGYVIRKNTRIDILGNREIINCILKNSSSKMKIRNTINNCLDSALTDDNIRYAIDNGYLLSKNSPDIIKNNSDYIKIMINNSNSYDVKNIIDNCGVNGLNKENIKLAMKRGYYIDNNTSSYILQNKEYLNIIISECKSIYDISNTLNYCNINMLDEDIIKLAVKRGYYIDSSSSDMIKSSYDIVFLILRNVDGINKIKSIIENIDPSIVDNNLLKLAVDKGYRINGVSSVLVRSNSDIINKMIRCLDSDSDIKMLIDSAIGEGLSYDNIVLAIDRGYYLDRYSVSLIRDSSVYVKKLLEKANRSIDVRDILFNCSRGAINEEIASMAILKGFYYKKEESELPFIKKDISYINNSNKLFEQLDKVKDFDSVIDIVLEVDNSILTKEVIDKLNTRGIILNYKTVDKLNLAMKDYFYKKICDYEIDYKNKLIDISNLIGHAFSVFYLDDDIFSRDILNKLGTNVVLKIYKYIYLICGNKNIKSLIIDSELDEFLDIYTNILEGDLNDFDVLYFNRCVDKYIEYSYLFKNGYNIENRTLIKKLFNNNYRNINISSLDDLDKYDDMVFNINKDILINSNNIMDIKDCICLILCNISYQDVCRLNRDIVSYDRINDLYNSIGDEDVRLKLNKYKVVISFIEYIINCDDIDILRNIGNTVNNMYNNDRDKFLSMFSLFLNISLNIKRMYEKEANNSLTNISTIEENKEIDIDKNSYPVDYIDIHGDYYFLVHVMNAFGNYSHISDFKHPRVSGKTFISLSSISKDKIGVRREACSIDNVTLIFDGINKGSLIGMAERDVFSYNGYFNNLDVSFGYCNFNTMKKNLEITPTYNEYVLYRENKDGSYIYPSGVLIYGDVPNEHEIEAANYLGVPLIKTHPKIKKLSDDKKKDTKKDELYKIREEVKYIANMLNVDIDKGRSR